MYDTIVFELERGDERFVLSSGDWFAIDRAFAQDTARRVSELPQCEIAFPRAQSKEHEPHYLARAWPELARTEGYGFFLFDDKLVRCEGAPSSLEVCDLLSELGHFVHVKQRRASSTLSHLFNQGTASATALMNDRSFRQAARQRCQDEGFDPGKLFPEATPEARTYTIVYAVIAPGSAPVGQILPFLSQISLTHAERLLRTMGFRVELAHITEG